MSKSIHLTVSAGLLSLSLSGAAVAGDSVWKDAVLHIRGGRDRNGDGVFNAVGSTQYASGTTEIPDVRHESTPNPQSNKIWYRGLNDENHAPSAIRHMTADVVSAAWGTTLKGQPCLHFPAGVNANGEHYPQSLMLWGGIKSSHALYPITGDKWTVLARLRLDAFPYLRTSSNGTNAWLVGLRNASNQEIRLGFRKHADKNTLPYLNVALGNATNPEQDNVQVAFECGEWMEIAYVFDGKTVRVSCGQAGKLRRWGNIAVGSSLSSTRPTDAIYLGSVSDTTKPSNNTDFCGVLHMFAIWNRALSDGEVVEAFGGTAGNLVRIGEEGCTKDLHVGGTTTGAVTLDPTTADQRNWPSAIGPETVLRIPFSVDPYRAGLNQVLRLLPCVGSSAGIFDATIDGKRVGNVEVRARSADGVADPSFFFVKGKFLAEGAHELVLTRRDFSDGLVKLDVIELGGSWRAGLQDGKMEPCTGDSGSGGMNAFDGADMWYPASQNQADFCAYTAYKSNGNRHTGITWRVPDGLATRATYAVTAHRQYAGTKIDHVMALNGVELGRVDINTTAVQSYELAKGALVDGLNVIDCYYADKTGGPWVTYDDFTCEVMSCESDKARVGFSFFLR